MTILPFIIFVIALVYSMGGFAGGSSYVLALSLSGVPHSQIPSTSLLCNIAVSSVVFITQCRAGNFRLRMALPFVVGSIPAAYLGARIHLPKEIFIVLLGASLIAASLRILFSKHSFEANRPIETNTFWITAVPLGGLMGFFSGLVGIGGGIFLWPTLLLMRWANVREASAAASFFILSNSLSGFVGQWQKGFAPIEGVGILVLFACMGGLVGSRMGSQRIAPLHLQRGFAVLLCALSFQFLLKAL